MSILWMIIVGLVVGALAKLIMPGKDPGGIIVTILLGIAGSFIGTYCGRLLGFGGNYSAGIIMSILGALLLLFVYRLITNRRAAA